MKIDVRQLSKIVKDVINEEKQINSLKKEIKNKLSKNIDINVSLKRLAEDVNDYLDILDYKGKNFTPFKLSTVSKFVNNTDPEIRKMAVRLLPENTAIKYINDNSSLVRNAVARKAPVKLLEKLTKKYPNDEILQEILDSKKEKLNEIGLLSMYRDKKLGDSGKTYSVDLSDTWYENKASEIISDYSKSGLIDNVWKERVVNNFCGHTKATSGVDIDREKLLRKINDLIEEGENNFLDEIGL